MNPPAIWEAARALNCVIVVLAETTMERRALD